MLAKNRYLIASCGVILHLMLRDLLMLGVFIVILLSLKLAGINRQLLLPSHLRFSVLACLLPLWDKLLINLVLG